MVSLLRVYTGEAMADGSITGIFDTMMQRSGSHITLTPAGNPAKAS